MSRLLRVYEAVLYAFMAVAAVLVAFMTVMVSLDVVLRNLGWGNLPWMVEISEYILYISTFMAAPWVLRQGAHVRVDVVIRMLPPWLTPWVDRVAELIGLAVCVFLVVYGASATLEALRLNTLIFKQLVIPEWWLFSVLPVTGLLLVIEFIVRLLRVRRAPTEPVRDGM